MHSTTQEVDSISSPITKNNKKQIQISVSAQNLERVVGNIDNLGKVQPNGELTLCGFPALLGCLHVNRQQISQTRFSYSSITCPEFVSSLILRPSDYSLVMSDVTLCVEEGSQMVVLLCWLVGIKKFCRRSNCNMSLVIVILDFGNSNILIVTSQVICKIIFLKFLCG